MESNNIENGIGPLVNCNMVIIRDNIRFRSWLGRMSIVGSLLMLLVKTTGFECDGTGFPDIEALLPVVGLKLVGWIE